ncbi:MAG: SbmA/BacA-like family transporter [Bradyrhizobium sp.]|uniref:SbmA/BacA-like family transporter n=1 Tax=Bradyrhizobium sp. TaxID=376 RepID=UPI003D0D969E
MLKRTYLAPGERELLLRFWKAAAGYWRGRAAWKAWLIAAALVATVLLQLLTQYRINFWNRDFFDAIERRDEAQLWIEAARFLPLAAASLSLAVFSVWGRMTMQRDWRQWLSNHLYDYWLSDDRYIRLKSAVAEHQAPEFRIAEDARVATDLPVDLALGLFSSVITLVTFVGVLWQVGGSLPLSIDGVTVNIPGYLVISVVIYSFLLAVAMWLTARHLTQVLEDYKRTEAELRTVGTHLRESGEGKALPNGAQDGRQSIARALRAVIEVWLVYCWQLMRITVVSHSNTLVTPVIGLLLCVPKYLAGTMTLGEVVQAAAAFVVVQTAFNWFTENYAKLADWAASANRVASLLLALDEVDGSNPD